MPEQVSCVGPVLMHGTSKCATDNDRQLRGESCLDLIGLRARQSISNVIIAVARANGTRGSHDLLYKRRFYTGICIGRPWAKVMESPVHAGICRTVMSSRVRQVRQVGVLEKMNRPQLSFAEVVCARGTRESVLEELIDSQNRLDFVTHGIRKIIHATMPRTLPR